MSVTVTQPEINTRETLIDNQQRYGITGKQLLESNSVSDARSLISAGRKNLIINGNFDIWQRGTSFLVQPTPHYSADRWETLQSGDFISSNTRQQFTVGQTDVKGNPNYYLRHTRDSVATVQNFIFIQRIEDVRLMAGKTYTIQMYLKSDVRIPAGIVLAQEFGDGGSPSATVFNSVTTFTTSAEWTKIVATITLPNIVGKTIGTSENSNTFLYVYEASGFKLFDCDIAQVQIEEGNNATDFENRPIAEELKLCQRYYQKSYAFDEAPGTVSTNGSIFEYGTRNEVDFTTGTHFATTMRANPTVTLYGTSTGAAGMVRNGANGDFAATALNIGERGFDLISAPGITTGDTTYHYTAEAEL